MIKIILKIKTFYFRIDNIDNLDNIDTIDNINIAFQNLII